ncbi:hypothetical protein CSE16_12050 [Solibacillus sp. R5-41]|uniref:DUF6877 family protein n=1 Tax=Solibacillus sp. R5-41 TaxID=2048654 RepID=UPI000C12718D|nr:DUF6877 family protein [Solibacillus sp. R5-41]ATP40719.1 hypothetical protein CSE16_12050 [Solibacillus sp. R5-41]
MTKQQVDQAISELISEYVFPFEALVDVHTRLLGCTGVHYAAQQLRYLQNLVNAGMAKKRGETIES